MAGESVNRRVFLLYVAILVVCCLNYFPTGCGQVVEPSTNHDDHNHDDLGHEADQGTETDSHDGHNHSHGELGDATGETWMWTMISSAVISIASTFGAALIFPFTLPSVENKCGLLPYIEIGLLGFAGSSIVSAACVHLIPHAILEGGGGEANIGVCIAMGMLLILIVNGLTHTVFRRAQLIGFPKKSTRSASIAPAPVANPDTGMDKAPTTTDYETGEVNTPEKGPVAEISSSEVTEEFYNMRAMGLSNLVGEAVHNFVDGIAVGAAFRVSNSVGLAAAVAAFLHELPQELGDFIVLRKSFDSPWIALLLNWLCSLTIFLGSIAVLAGFPPSYTPYLLAITGGSFLFTGLSLIFPVIKNELIDSAVTESSSMTLRTAIVCSCSFIGFLVVVLFAVYLPH